MQTLSRQVYQCTTSSFQGVVSMINTQVTLGSWGSSNKNFTQ